MKSGRRGWGRADFFGGGRRKRGKSKDNAEAHRKRGEEFESKMVSRWKCRRNPRLTRRKRAWGTRKRGRTVTQRAQR
jgi:hypothetical protein